MTRLIPIKIMNIAIDDIKKQYQWQPVDTAPYDTMIFVLYKRGPIGTIIFDKGYEKYSEITHWLPIPPIPKI